MHCFSFTGGAHRGPGIRQREGMLSISVSQKRRPHYAWCEASPKLQAQKREASGLSYRSYRVYRALLQL